MHSALSHFRRVRFLNSLCTSKLISSVGCRHVHQFRTSPFRVACTHETSKIRLTECVLGKLNLLRPRYRDTGIICRPFHVTNPSRTNPVTLWLVSNAVTIAVAIIGHQVLLVRRGKIAGGDPVLSKLMRFVGITFLTLTVIMLFYYLTHIETAPITKRRRFMAFSNEEMIHMTAFETRLIDMEFSRFYLNTQDATFKRVKRVVGKILAANQDIKEIKDRQWNLVVIDLPDIKNAFILPNGNMYVFTGILRLCRNDDEVGFVVSHELSHAVLEHLAEQMSHMYVGEFLFLLPVFLIWSALPTLAALAAHVLARSCADALFNLPFSRFSEVEADIIGIQLASKACFDPRLALIFWKKMMLTTEEGLPWRYRFEWLSTHPSYGTRARYLEKVIPRALQVRRDYNCPPLPEYVVSDESEFTFEDLSGT